MYLHLHVFLLAMQTPAKHPILTFLLFFYLQMLAVDPHDQIYPHACTHSSFISLPTKLYTLRLSKESIIFVGSYACTPLCAF